jgi:hypothetical protein
MKSINEEIKMENEAEEESTGHPELNLIEVVARIYDF